MSGSRLHTSPALGLLGLLLLARLRQVTTFSMGAPDSACQGNDSVEIFIEYGSIDTKKKCIP